MTNAEMAARLEKRVAQAKAAGTPVWIDEDDEAAVLAGAKALREVDELKAKWKREECAHCDERPGGHEGTIWCAECLNWWRQQSENQALQEALREVERLRGAIQAREDQIDHLFRHSGRQGSEDYDALEVSAAWDRLRAPVIATDPRESGPLPTPDPMPALAALTIRKDSKDARIAELEAALRGVWSLREMTERTYEDAYKSMFKSRGEAEWDAVDAALKEAK